MEESETKPMVTVAQVTAALFPVGWFFCWVTPERQVGTTAVVEVHRRCASTVCVIDDDTPFASLVCRW